MFSVFGLFIYLMFYLPCSFLCASRFFIIPFCQCVFNLFCFQFSLQTKHLSLSPVHMCFLMFIRIFYSHHVALSLLGTVWRAVVFLLFSDLFQYYTKAVRVWLIFHFFYPHVTLSFTTSCRRLWLAWPDSRPSVSLQVQDTLEDGVGVVEPVSTGSGKLASQLRLLCEGSTSAPSQELAELLQRPHLLVWPLACAQSGVM